MAKKGKSASRKVKDKWKSKDWYKIYAPHMFNKTVLGETPSTDPSELIGRKTEASVHDLTGDFSKMHVKILFEIDDVDGYDAKTVFIGHDLTSDYIRRLTRRKRTRTDNVVDVRTKDGYLVRIKIMSVTEKRIQSSQESAVRSIMSEEVHKSVPEMTISDLVKKIISGDLAKELAQASKVIVPIKRVEIRKSEVLEMGTPVPDEDISGEEASEESEETPEEIPEGGRGEPDVERESEAPEELHDEAEQGSEEVVEEEIEEGPETAEEKSEE